MAIAPKIMSRLAESGVWRAGVVLKLEANILMAGMSDIMSVPDVSGRRWLGIPEVARTLPGEFKREFQKEMEMKIFYDGIDIGTRRVDFFVAEFIMVELKAVIKLEDVHLAQAMNYCQAYNLPIGLLINFGSKSLEYKRVYNVNHTENKEYIKNNPTILKSKNDN